MGVWCALGSCSRLPVWPSLTFLAGAGGQTACPDSQDPPEGLLQACPWTQTQDAMSPPVRARR